MNQRDELAAYFTLAFGITWIGIAVVSAVFGPSQVGLFVPMAAGPTTAALILTSAGRTTTVRALLAGLGRWRVGAGWYAVALLLSPMLFLTVLGLLRIISTQFTPGLFAAPDPVALIGFAVLAGVAAGLFEEIGWTGFATPRLLARYGYLRAGALLGALWATWHIAADLSGIGEWGELLPLRVLAWMYAMMVPYRILMTKVYSRTGSLLIGVLMHATFTGGQVLLEPIGISHLQQLVWWGAAGAALWVVVGLVIAFDRPSVNATLEEAKRAMPADGIVPTPVLVSTHAITIDAPPERVWPWLAQMGSLRGGWYSYDFIDNGGQSSAERICQEYQLVGTGDIMPSLPGATDTFIVAWATPPHDLTLTVPGPSDVIASWEHLLEAHGSQTRLMARSRVAPAWRALARSAHRVDQPLSFIELIYRVLGRLPDSLMLAFGRLGHRWMEARHLRGIKWRAEASLP